MGPRYQSLTRDNLLHRISNTQQQLLNLAEEMQLATTPGKRDRSLLKVVLQEENTVLVALEDFLDDLYALDPEAYHSHFSHLPFPRPPHPDFKEDRKESGITSDEVDAGDGKPGEDMRFWQEEYEYEQKSWDSTAGASQRDVSRGEATGSRKDASNVNEKEQTSKKRSIH
ncbi:hypothetical protein BJ165DRAFT_1526522 [Panaeolus papilionaceus]|nr:hypothetical protein BJ165DRAFT_1526522 [Panaeolus papilionaceus]